MTYYAFVALFPLLLLATSILGFVLQNDPDLYQQVLDSALGQFPVIGDQLGRPEGLQGSTSAVVVGILIAFYGSLGLGTAIQNAMNIAWSVPRNSRPNPFLLRLKSLLLVIAAGRAVRRDHGVGAGRPDPGLRWRAEHGDEVADPLHQRAAGRRRAHLPAPAGLRPRPHLVARDPGRAAGRGAVAGAAGALRTVYVARVLAETSLDQPVLRRWCSASSAIICMAATMADAGHRAQRGGSRAGSTRARC